MTLIQTQSELEYHVRQEPVEVEKSRLIQPTT